jgi:hypothetical protein
MQLSVHKYCQHSHVQKTLANFRTRQNWKGNGSALPFKSPHLISNIFHKCFPLNFPTHYIGDFQFHFLPIYFIPYALPLSGPNKSTIC